MARLREDRGFLMLELLAAITVMTIALTALVTVFSAGMIGMRRASQVTTATFLADAQMETFRAMTGRDIGLDLSVGTVAALDSTYTDDSACANSTISATCALDGVTATESIPTGTIPNSCATINSWYPNTLPCTPSRTVSVSSPDAHSYRVDTYVVQLAAKVTGTLARERKQVTVVVRDGSQLTRVLAREISLFDCSSGVTPGSTDC